MSYSSQARSHFQKKIRRGSQVLRDHVARTLNPIIEARVQLIPAAPGSDWRDLPNTAVTLRDGTKARRLVYTHGERSSGVRRGVCRCVEGGHCHPADKQEKTLIPWSLPHTGSR